MSGYRTGVQNALFLIIGRIVAQIISFLGMIYIARILGPKGYGIYNIVTAFVGMFSIATFAGLNRVVVRRCSEHPEKLEEIINLTIGLRNLFSVVATGICLLSLFFIHYDTQIKIYILLFSFELLFIGFRDNFNVVFQSVEKMQYISILAILRMILFNSLAIIFLMLGYSIFALLVINLLSGLAILYLNYRFARKIVDFKLFSQLVWDGKLLKEGVFFSLIQFFNNINKKIDLVMLSFLASPFEVGIYALPFKITLRANILRKSMATAFFPIFVKKKHRNALREKTLLKKVLMIGLPSFLLLFLLMPYLGDAVVFLFGSKYSSSTNILKVLIVSLLLTFFVIPFSLALQAGYNEKILAGIGFLRTILKVVLNLVFFSKFRLLGIAYATLVTEVIGSLLIVIISIRNRSEAKPLMEEVAVEA